MILQIAISSFHRSGSLTLLFCNGKRSANDVIYAGVEGKYSISFYILDAAHFGIPQHRKRLIIIGNRIGANNPVLKPLFSDTDSNKKPFHTARDGIEYIKTKTGHNLSKTAFFKIKKQLKSEGRDWVLRLRDDREEFLSEYRQRYEEMIVVGYRNRK